MYAIIREGNGRYYTSVVFGYYDTSEKLQDYRYKYWIVLNREKTALVSRDCWGIGELGLTSMVLVVDADESGWNLDDKRAQSLDFLPTGQLLDMVRESRVPGELLGRCLELDRAYVYDPYPEILTEGDIRSFQWVSGGLHDAYISQLRQAEDELYLYFKGEWGCDVEVWFTGEVDCSCDSRTPGRDDEFWLDSSVFFHDGFVYLIDDSPAGPENAREGWCWFRGRHMKYHVIPE